MYLLGFWVSHSPIKRVIKNITHFSYSFNRHLEDNFDLKLEIHSTTFSVQNQYIYLI